MKKIKLIKILLIVAVIFFLNINFGFIKKIFKIKANHLEVKLILKLQGDYSHYNKMPIFAKVTLYTPYQKIKEFENLVLLQEINNIFSTNFSLENIDLNQVYSLFIKPNKYFGRVIKNQIFKTTNINVIDLSNEYFFSGDFEPADGKITAYEISLIIKNLGNKNNPQTDINSDGITDTQDYSLSLYSLKDNIKDEEIILLPLPTPTITQTSILTSTPTPTLTSTLTPTITHTPTPTTILTPTPTSTLTSTPTPTITQTPTPTLTLTSSQTTTPLPTNSNISQYCQLMENELPNASMIYPNGSTQIPKTTNKICAWTHGNYYSLPYRNPNCTVTQAMIDKAYERMKTFYPTYYQKSKLKEQWQIVQNLSIKYNFNPLFVISLWIEESAAGGATQAQQLGCLYRRNKDGTFTFLGPESNICQQMECLFGSGAVDPGNFARWACSYQHGYQIWKNDDCLNVTTFTRTIEFWYNYMSNQGMLLNPDCRIEFKSPSDNRCP